MFFHRTFKIMIEKNIFLSKASQKLFSGSWDDVTWRNNALDIYK